MTRIRNLAVVLTTGLFLGFAGKSEAAPVTYTIEGTVSFASASDNLLPAALTFIRDAVPDGAAFSVSFDMDFAAADTDSSSSVGLFEKAISNQSSVIGGNVFSRIPASSCNHPLECNVRAENVEISPFVQFNVFEITTGFTYSTDLATELFELITGTEPVFSTPLISSAFSFFESFPGLRDPLSILDPTTLSFPGDQRLTLFTQRSYTTTGSGGGGGRIDYDLAVTNIREGGLAVAIPAPAAPYLMLCAVIAIVWRRRSPRAVSTVSRGKYCQAMYASASPQRNPT